MPRPPAKPKVSFRWDERGRESHAICKLCTAQFWAYSRHGLYPSTASHKLTCPKVTEWMTGRRQREMQALRQAMDEAGLS